LAELIRLHDEHVARLDGQRIARVQLRDWRLAAGLDEFAFWRAVRSLEESGQIIRECGFVRPTPRTNRDSK
jgi:hypothetical protein